MGKIFDSRKVKDADSFIIGDVVLSIPPSSITATRIENNEEITSLRSKFPMIRKTGLSMMTVTVMWQAVMLDGGNFVDWQKLRRIFAIFKAAPFVQIENDHLRTVLNMDGDNSRMAFGLKNLTISTSPDSIDVLEARMDMVFFNYLPYSTDFAYVRVDDSGATKKVNSIQSGVFSAYIDKWMKQNMDEDLTQENILDWKTNNTGSTRFVYNFFKPVPNPLTPVSQIPAAVLKLLPNSQQLIDSNNSSGGVGVSAYMPVLKDPANSGYLLDHFTDLTSFFYLPQELEFTADGSMQDDTYTTGIIINVSNKLAQIPMSSYQYPTYQHMGPATTTVGISFQDNDPDGSSLGSIQNILNRMNNQFFALRSSWRKTSSIHKMQAIFIENQILNMFGIRSMLPNSFKTSTAQEGLYTTGELLGSQYENIFEALEPYTIRNSALSHLDNLLNTFTDPTIVKQQPADFQKAITPFTDWQTALQNNDINYIEKILSSVPIEQQQHEAFINAIQSLPQLPYNGPTIDWSTLWAFSNATWGVTFNPVAGGFGAAINKVIPGLGIRKGASPMSWTDALLIVSILKYGNFIAPTKPGLFNFEQIVPDYKKYEAAIDAYGKAQTPTFQSIILKQLFSLRYYGDSKFKASVDDVAHLPAVQNAISNDGTLQINGPGVDPINSPHGAYGDFGIESDINFSPVSYLIDYSQENLQSLKDEMVKVVSQTNNPAFATTTTDTTKWTYSTTAVKLDPSLTGGPGCTQLFARTSFDINNPATAFPTFKLFLIEDASGSLIYAYDDFYSYASVQSIEIIKYRDKPDAAMLKISNLAGILSHRTYDNSVDGKREYGLDPSYAAESSAAQVSNPDGGGIPIKERAYKVNGITYVDGLPATLKYYPLQTGSKIQVRMGFSNNPDKLFPVFSGIITEINEENEMITLMAQSFMVELLDIPDNGFTPTNGWNPISLIGDDISNVMKAVADLAHGQIGDALHSGWQGLSLTQKSPAFGGAISSTDGHTDSVLATLIGAPTAKHFGKWQIRAEGTDPFIRGFAWSPLLAKITPGSISNAFATAYDRSAENILIDQIRNFDATFNQGDEKALQRAWNFEAPYGLPATYSIPDTDKEPVQAPWTYMRDVARRRPEYILAVKNYGYPWSVDATLVYANPLDFYLAKPAITDPTTTPGPESSVAFAAWWNSSGKSKFLGLQRQVDDILNYTQTKFAPADTLQAQAAKISSSNNPSDLTSYLTDLQTNLIEVGPHNPFTTYLDNIVNSAINLLPFANMQSAQVMNRQLDGSIQTLIHDMTAYITQMNTGNLGVDPSNAVQPTRKYHYIAKEHIVHNGINLNGDFYNTVKIGDETYCANDYIPDQHRRVLDCNPLVVDFERNIKSQGEEVKAGYAQSFLAEELGKMYNGDLILRGYPEIEPHDVLMINDPALVMKGPVLVDKVIHSFDSEQGFITIVSPKQLVMNNEASQAAFLSILDYAGTQVDQTRTAFVKTLSPGEKTAYAAAVATGGAALWVAGEAVGALIGGTFLAPVAVIGAIALACYGIGMMASGARKLRPMIPVPLTRYGKAWTAGLEGYRVDGFLNLFKDKWENFLAGDYYPLIESWRTLGGSIQTGIASVPAGLLTNKSSAAKLGVGFITNPSTGVTSKVTARPSSIYRGQPSVETNLLAQYAQQYGVPLTFAKAIAWVESGGNLNPPAQPAGNGSHAAGIMQLEPGTAKLLGVQNVNNISQNIEGGVKLLAQLLKQFGNDLNLTAAGYYSGPRAVSNAGPGIPAAAMQYVVDVMNAIATQSS